jgi:midasin
MQQAIQTLPSTRLERRKEKQKLPIFLYAFWKALSKSTDIFISTTSAGKDFGIVDVSPKTLRQLFWAFHALTCSSNFDRATFQTYLKMLTVALSSLANSAPSTSLITTISKEVAVFDADVQPISGLGMERIWRHFRPNTSKSWKQLSAILNLEGLADRLDVAMWKSSLKLDEMVQIRERFASSLELVRRQEVDAGELITVQSNFRVDPGWIIANITIESRVSC